MIRATLGVAEHVFDSGFVQFDLYAILENSDFFWIFLSKKSLFGHTILLKTFLEL